MVNFFSSEKLERYIVWKVSVIPIERVTETRKRNEWTLSITINRNYLIGLIDLLGNLDLEIHESGFDKFSCFLFRKFFWIDQWSNFMSQTCGSGGQSHNTTTRRRGYEDRQHWQTASSHSLLPHMWLMKFDQWSTQKKFLSKNRLNLSNPHKWISRSKSHKRSIKPIRWFWFCCNGQRPLVSISGFNVSFDRSHWDQSSGVSFQFF